MHEWGCMLPKIFSVRASYVSESNRSAELIYVLKPELDRIAANPHRSDAVRERAFELANKRAFCR